MERERGRFPLFVPSSDRFALSFHDNRFSERASNVQMAFSTVCDHLKTRIAQKRSGTLDDITRLQILFTFKLQN